MNQILILCRSLTQAQRGIRLLEHHMIHASLAKAPQKLSVNGCGYAIALYKREHEALVLLKTNGVKIGKTFEHRPDGSYREVER